MRFKTNSSIEFLWTPYDSAGYHEAVLTLDGVDVETGEVPGSAQPSILFEGLESGREYELTVSHFVDSDSDATETGTAVSTTS